LAAYFCLSDAALIGQVVYYQHLKSRRKATSAEAVAVSENDPLLPQRAGDVDGIAGSKRRSLPVGDGRDPQSNELVVKHAEAQRTDNGISWLRNTLYIVLICFIGTVSWLIAWKTDVWTPTLDDNPGKNPDSRYIDGAQTLGWISAVCYLSGRIPQIWENHRAQSCEGKRSCSAPRCTC
jgi:hypothetical protein